MEKVGRREFFKAMAAAVAGAAVLGEALDPEKLFWVPGAKTIFVPETLAVRPSLEQTLAVNRTRSILEGAVLPSFNPREHFARSVAKNNARGYDASGGRYVLTVAGPEGNAQVVYDEGWNALHGFDFRANRAITKEELTALTSRLAEADRRQQGRVRGAAVIGGGRAVPRFTTDDDRYVFEGSGRGPESPLADAASEPGKVWITDKDGHKKEAT